MPEKYLWQFPVSLLGQKTSFLEVSNTLIFLYLIHSNWVPWSAVKNLPATHSDGICGLNPRVSKSPRRTLQLTPIFLPGEYHGQKRLEDYSPQGRKESDTTEAT